MRWPVPIADIRRDSGLRAAIHRIRLGSVRWIIRGSQPDPAPAGFTAEPMRMQRLNALNRIKTMGYGVFGLA